MDRTTTIIILAFASLVLAAMATAIFIYVIVPWRRRRRAAKAKAAAPRPVNVDSSEEAQEPDTHAPSKQNKKVKQHSLFIIFDQPSKDSDERLTQWLREKDAHYDALKKIFLIDGQQPSNPVTIANAFPPGEMPDLLRGENHDPIKGISLLVKPPLRKRRNQQMHVYVELAKEMQTVFRGKMLNEQREPATDSNFEKIIGE
ncbi:cell division protein ZipA C-terminal FtsZ-binding domain-containing protein [Halovibrio sp. HP20-50]|uniref:cell division protein ZipA C-terminal FtsZ-binding domain-containing protein n=1 Tax=Halovibrio sp. HP20-59 TaxID=3080275 RepID=UPI00294AF325|nr:cell division protein ZipA C-terminal FtsZ-binding domain-containing protein [Halovibrio sp. HP20-59]MEA2117726.1 cell division protein ZipA C-terminal FtsZ-binding domain-containing protein [Halovibrio sp. HP20-59]